MPQEMKILFVDDEPNILNGLKRMLRNMRNIWKMTFVESGQEALHVLQDEPHDVIVSDMRMPGMNGAELLLEVMNRYPQIIRIILSGHTEKDMILKSVRPAHQYLSKPSDADTIVHTVKRTSELRSLLKEPNLTKVVTKIDTLPSLPSLYLDIMKELRSTNSSLQKIGDIISKDVGMTAKILQLVNSAFFGLPCHISSPAQAAGLLGVDIIKSLVLSAHIFSQLNEEDLPGFSLENMMEHSFYTAKLAKEIARKETQNQTVIDSSYMAGILHDSGKIILAGNFPRKYAEVLSKTGNDKRPAWAIEQEAFGTSHSEVGAYLMGLWGLPDDIVEAIAYHHKPMDMADDQFSPLAALHVANILDCNYLTSSVGEVEEQVDVKYLAKLNKENRLDEWRRLSVNVREQGDKNV